MTTAPCPVEVAFLPKQASLDSVHEIIDASTDRETQ
jgi:hypothetical protein